MSEIDTYLALQLESPEKFRQVISDNIKDVAVEQFNRDHLHLLEIFLRFHAVMENFRMSLVSEAGWDEVEGVLVDLADYTKTHLDAEEAAMKRVDFPDLMSHLAAHDRFRLMVSAYQEVVSARDPVKLFALKYNLFDWFFKHINTLDVRYAPFLGGH